MTSASTSGWSWWFLRRWPGCLSRPGAAVLAGTALWCSWAVAASPATPGDQAEQGIWILPGSWNCLISDCATFTTRETPPRVFQQGVRKLELPGDGILRLPPGGSRLVWQQGASKTRFTLFGPGALRLGREGGLTPLGASRLKKGGKARGFELGYGPLVISSEGTKFSVVATASGVVCLKVTEGEVRVEMGARPPLHLTRGQGVYASPSDGDGSSLENLTGEDLDEQYRALITASQATNLKGSTTAEGALDAFAARLPDLEPEALLREALAVEERYPNTPAAARALYLAWLKADGSQARTAAEQLETRLRTAYGSSIWTGMLPAAAGAGQPAASDSTGAP